MEAPQIKSLTATRAFAAIMVFIHHFGGSIFPFKLLPSVFGSGNVAVSYFFVLSGFVLYITYRDKPITYSDYLKRRIGRIIPTYMLALLLTVVVVTLLYQYPLFSRQAAKEIAASAALVQAYIPSYPMVLNLPGWSISVELLFYLLFPVFLLLQKQKQVIFVACAIILFTASQLIHLKYYPYRHSLGDNIVDTIFYNPAIHLSQFMTGMLGGWLYTRSKLPVSASRILMYPLFIAIVLLLVYRPGNISYHVGLIAPVFMLFIVTTAITNPWLMTRRPLVYLGEISYGIYILQLPVYMAVAALNTRYVHLPPPYLFLAALATLTGLAALSYRYVEQPLRLLMRRRRSGRTAPVMLQREAVEDQSSGSFGG